MEEAEEEKASTLLQSAGIMDFTIFFDLFFVMLMIHSLFFNCY